MSNKKKSNELGNIVLEALKSRDEWKVGKKKARAHRQGKSTVAAAEAHRMGKLAAGSLAAGNPGLADRQKKDGQDAKSGTLKRTSPSTVYGKKKSNEEFYNRIGNIVIEAAGEWEHAKAVGSKAGAKAEGGEKNKKKFVDAYKSAAAPARSTRASRLEKQKKLKATQNESFYSRICAIVVEAMDSFDRATLRADDIAKRTGKKPNYPRWKDHDIATPLRKRTLQKIKREKESNVPSTDTKK